MKLPKYVQAWVDAKGRPHCYFRRRGFPRVRLSGLPWSPSFMAEYEKAMSGARTAIGAGRIKPGSVAAVIAEYLDSQTFFTSKSAGTQRMRRGMLERFRAAYGDRPFARLARPCARSVNSGSSAATCARTRPQTSSLRPLRATDSTRGPKTRSRNSRRTIQSARSHVSRSRYCSTARKGVPMSSAWGGSTSARHLTGQPSTSSNARPALSF